MDYKTLDIITVFQTYIILMLSHSSIDTELQDTVNNSLHDVCGLPRTPDSASLQGFGLDPAMAEVVPCAWTRFSRPGLGIVIIVTLFYVIVGFAATILNGLVVILYFR